MKINFIKDHLLQSDTTIPALFLKNVNPAVFNIIDKPEKDTDILGATAFNINSLSNIKTLRLKYPNNKIIVGGIAVDYLYKRLFDIGIDYVYFGEALNFNESCIADKNTKSVYVEDNIDFNKAPIIQIGAKNWYFLVEKGCPYKCEFCYVSNKQKFQAMNIDRVKSIILMFEKKYKSQHITFLANEGLIKIKLKDFFIKNKLNNNWECQSLPLRSYLQNLDLYKDKPISRFGIELPTEKNRILKLPNIKKIKDDEIHSILKMNHGNVVLNFFYIYAYPGIKDAEYEQIYDLYSQYNIQHRETRLTFTTFDPQPYCPCNGNFKEWYKSLFNYRNLEELQLSNKVKYFKRLIIIPCKKIINAYYELLLKYSPSGYKLVKPDNTLSFQQYYNKLMKLNNNYDCCNYIDNYLNNLKIKDGYLNLL